MSGVETSRLNNSIGKEEDLGPMASFGCSRRGRLSTAYLSLMLSLAVLLLPSPIKVSAQTGKTDFQALCAQCHGIDGKGDKVEDLQGPDLTHLSQQHGGRFPSQEVYEVIDGRKKRPEHERLLDMPLWGEYFQQKGIPKDAAETKTKSRITALVRYIQGLQEK
jgi:hypothetical protein